jgi:hypothetical protein
MANVKTTPPRGPLRSLAAWLTRLGGAMTGDAPHAYAAEYPWLRTCWCGKPKNRPVHWSAQQVIAARREAAR